ncbi:holin [Salmonella enterica subsp. salamae]|nr:holin [Salmonella enterica subsp. salamae]
MIHTQEVAQVAVAFLLSVISGIGTFLMDVRAGRQTGNLLGLVTEIFVAVTAGVIAYLWGQHRGWDLSVIYMAVTIASNNGHEVISGMKRINIDMILNGITNLMKKGGSK